MPDLTVASMVLAILLLPGRPLSPAVVSGLLVVLVTVHHPLAMGAAYLAVGGLIKLGADQWDLTAPALHYVAVGVAQLLLLSVAFMLSVPLTWDVCPLVAAHLLLTAMCVPLVRSFLMFWIPSARSDPR